jgi:hypothetical protein
MNIIIALTCFEQKYLHKIMSSRVSGFYERICEISRVILEVSIDISLIFIFMGQKSIMVETRNIPGF